MPDSTKNIVDLAQKPLLSISAHEHTIRQIAYLPGGERLVTCSDGGVMRIWNVENGEQEGTSMEHEKRVPGLAVAKDGKWMPPQMAYLIDFDDGTIIEVPDLANDGRNWKTYRDSILHIATLENLVPQFDGTNVKPVDATQRELKEWEQRNNITSGYPQT
ncbi:hypothetical protein BU15DRAFT_80454 [Melanogaster broomeanus]|nr:hypothetical protein BU15DRAFT_80454 [Melanogaster broomeanus]